MELSAKFKLDALQDAENINDLLTKEDSSKIGIHVTSTFKLDKESRQEWEKKNKASEELALQVSQPKTYPFKNASNVKFPLLTVAAMQFWARVINTPVTDRLYRGDPQKTQEQLVEDSEKILNWTAFVNILNGHFLSEFAGDDESLANFRLVVEEYNESDEGIDEEGSE